MSMSSREKMRDMTYAYNCCCISRFIAKSCITRIPKFCSSPRTCTRAHFELEQFSDILELPMKIWSATQNWKQICRIMPGIANLHIAGSNIRMLTVVCMSQALIYKEILFSFSTLHYYCAYSFHWEPQGLS
jgi:hypothetical protein